MGQDEGNGLWVLVLNEGEEVAALGFLEERKRSRADGLLDGLEDLIRVGGGERLFEEFPGVVEAALFEVLAGLCHLVELFDDGASLIGGHSAKGGNGGGDVFYGVLVHERKDLGGDFLTEADQKQSGLGHAGQFRGFFGYDHATTPSPSIAL